MQMINWLAPSLPLEPALSANEAGRIWDKWGIGDWMKCVAVGSAWMGSENPEEWAAPSALKATETTMPLVNSV